MKPLFLATFLAAVYFAVAFNTLSHYGISWDETIHFYRGQAYLRYFLTGKTTYEGLPQVNLQGTNGDPGKVMIPRRSFYQSDLYNGEFMLKDDSGHPPINGELAALSNFIFYQKLGMLGDVESHHLFNILASSLLVFVVVFFASETIGLFGGIIAGLSVILYPLFWAESHFNIKDPPEAAFFAATIWSFFKSTKYFSKRWLLLSFLFFALAAGTKFNAFFIPPIIAVYFVLRDKFNPFLIWEKAMKVPKDYLLLLFFGPLITFAIFVGTWPFLWQNFPENLLKIFVYYKEIGINTRYQPDNFFIFGFNTFPLLWILFTTPPSVLILFIIGIISVVLNRSKIFSLQLMWLLWFVVPVARVTLPETTLYGGIRQILEFLPAMALVAAVGAWQITQWLKMKQILSKIFIIILFLWPLVVLVKMHPYENVYFNFILGGLPGAMRNNFPSWGNSFGNAYFQGIKWINENAESGSKLALIQGTSPNAPAIYLREDIDYKAGNWSGIERGGEYLMELTFNDSARNFNYAWDYVENFLDPVYELKVDDVSILKIWKNDLQHTKETSKTREMELSGSIKVEQEGRQIVLDLGEIAKISRVYVYFGQLSNCLMPKVAFVELSEDKNIWNIEKDQIPFRQVKQEENISAGQIEYFIAGKEVRYIKFSFENNHVCPLNYKSSRVLVLE